MQELLFLLLPVAALSGWWLARASTGKSADSKNNCANEPNYYKGINFLLNEQPDKAIDVFIQLLEVDTETVETHLALGSLFRKRGEVDRAIRIHQNLIARPSLGQEQRANALLELGQDYLYAGLHDRAENLFNELVESGRLQRKALENLREIYQKEKLWDKCLQVISKLQGLSDNSYVMEISHYYCELAEQARLKNDRSHQLEYIRKARQAMPASVRALMMEADLEAENKHYRKASSLYERIIKDNPAFVGEILDKLLMCLSHNTSAVDIIERLQSLYKETTNSAVLRRLVTQMLQNRSRQEVVDYLLDVLRQSSSLQSLELLTELKRDGGNSDELRKIFSVINDTLHAEISSRSAYLCQRCGFTAKTLHWQCPGCRSWGRMTPLNEQDRHSVPCMDIKKGSL